MNATSTHQQTANRWVKYGGVFFVCFSLVCLGAGIFSWRTGSPLLASGLFQLLFSPERIDDERVQQLKLRAIMWGYALGFLLVVMHDLYRSYPANRAQGALTAVDGFIVGTSVALVLFHFWRWQDGRESGTG